MFNQIPGIVLGDNTSDMDACRGVVELEDSCAIYEWKVINNRRIILHGPFKGMAITDNGELRY